MASIVAAQVEVDAVRADLQRDGTHTEDRYRRECRW